MWYTIIVNREFNGEINKVSVPHLKIDLFDKSKDQIPDQMDVTKFAAERLAAHLASMDPLQCMALGEDTKEDYRLSATDVMFKVSVQPPQYKARCCERFLPNLSTTLFVLGVFFINIADFLAIQTANADSQTTLVTGGFGAFFSVTMTLFLYAYSGTRRNASLIGRRLDNSECFNKGKQSADDTGANDSMGAANPAPIRLESSIAKNEVDDEKSDVSSPPVSVSEKASLVSTTPASDSDAVNQSVEKVKQIGITPGKIIAIVLLTIPPLAKVGFSAASMYQNLITVGEKLNNSGKMYIAPDVIKVLASILFILEVINGVSFNLSFTFKAAPFLERVFTGCAKKYERFACCAKTIRLDCNKSLSENGVVSHQTSYRALT